MQARRRGRHCLTAGGNVTALDQVRLQRVTRHDSAAVHTLLQLTPNVVVYGVEVRTFS